MTSSRRPQAVVSVPDCWTTVIDQRPDPERSPVGERVAQEIHTPELRPRWTGAGTRVGAAPRASATRSICGSPPSPPGAAATSGADCRRTASPPPAHATVRTDPPAAHLGDDRAPLSRRHYSFPRYPQHLDVQRLGHHHPPQPPVPGAPSIPARRDHPILSRPILGRNVIQRLEQLPRRPLWVREIRAVVLATFLNRFAGVVRKSVLSSSGGHVHAPFAQ